MTTSEAGVQAVFAWKAWTERTGGGRHHLRRRRSHAPGRAVPAAVVGRVAEEPGDWFFDTDGAIFKNLGHVIEAQDAVLLGRGTYDTSTPPAKEWANSTVITSPAPKYVAALKQEAGGDVGIHGSIALARSLLEADLIDEMRLVVAPTIAGRGRRMFDGDDKVRRLELVDLDRAPSGALMLHYRADNRA